MSGQITLNALIRTLGSKLDLHSLNTDPDPAGLELPVETAPAETSTAGLFNPALPHPVTIVSSAQLDYLHQLPATQSNAMLSELLSSKIRLIILSDSQGPSNDVPPNDLLDKLCRGDKPCYTSSLPASALIEEINTYSVRCTQKHEHVHGVLMDVLGIGVLLTGTHNVGKSELALELISRGHSLVADDSPEFVKISSSTLEGKSPPTLYEFLEVRGLGIMNIRAMFGDNSIKDSKQLTLIIHLQQTPYQDIDATHRVYGNIEKNKLLGVEIDCITLPVAPGRNLAVLVETAVRNYLLRMKGYNAAAEFVKRQHRHMESNKAGQE